MALSTPPPREGNEHRHPTTVLLVLAAVERDEVSFLELDGQQDVRRRRDRKHQMRQRHRRRHPECEEPADVERMPNETVRSGSRETQARIWTSDEIQPHLS